MIVLFREGYVVFPLRECRMVFLLREGGILLLLGGTYCFRPRRSAFVCPRAEKFLP